MQINEAFRRIVIGHLRLLIACILLGAAAVVLIGAKGTTGYRASARVQASSETVGSDTEADSVLNRVRGVATSPDIVAAALRAAKISDRSAQHVAAHEVTVDRLGSSAVVDIAVTDKDPRIAVSLATAVANQVVEFLRGPGSLPSQALLKQLDQQQQDLYQQRSDLVSKLGGTQDPTKTAPLSAQISTIDQQLADIASTVRQLQVTAATDSSATVISTAADPVVAKADRVLRAGLGTAAGLLAGLLISALIEVVRPRVADARCFGQELGVPLLGRVEARTVEFPATAAPGGTLTRPTRKRTFRADTAGLVALLQAAERTAAGRLVLVGAGTQVDECALAEALNTQLAATGDGRPLPGPVNGHNRTHNGERTGLSPHPAMPATGGDAWTVTATKLWMPGTDVHARQAKRIPGVIALQELTEHPSGERQAVVVVAAPLAPYDSLRRVSDLATATGWPVLGVFSIGRGVR
jgi:capsular polysaccharide biosynthesis protein